MVIRKYHWELGFKYTKLTKYEKQPDNNDWEGDDFSELLGEVIAKIFFYQTASATYFIVNDKGQEKYRLNLNDFSKQEQIKLSNFIKSNSIG